MRLDRAKWIGLCFCTFALGGALKTGGESAPELTLLQTGSGTPLITSSEELFIAGFADPRIRFTFGFATDEISEPGAFLDSFTFTLEGGDSASTLLFLTADATGVAWAPSTPGTVPLSPDSITAIPTEYPPAIEPALTQRYAYQVEALLPEDFAGQAATFRADLFDNLDGTASLGWFAEIAVVPEPRASLVALLAAFIYLIRRKR